MRNRETDTDRIVEAINYNTVKVCEKLAGIEAVLDGILGAHFLEGKHSGNAEHLREIQELFKVVQDGDSHA